MSMVKLSEKTMLRWAVDDGLSLSRIPSSSSHLSHFEMSAEEMDRLVAEWSAFRAKVAPHAQFPPPTPYSTENGGGEPIAASDTAKSAESPPSEPKTLL